ncbi:MAG: hypothetical protein LBC53_06225 [Spirochaetaceae bacterium]|jgi:YbbR domain-containing protein|nr:hypothetical protein [Spirochaetaceae bacterium]
MIVNNWPVKALSLVAAILLFQFHRIMTLDSRTISVPLRTENSGDLIAVNNYPKTVRVTLHGEKKLIDPITENDVDAFLDLLYCNLPGAYTLPIGIVKKGSALDVDPLEIILEPNEIRLELDKIASKTVSITPNITGSPQKGYRIASTRIFPPALRVDGPESLLKKISSLQTEPIDVSGKNSSFSISAKILNQEPLLELIGSKTAEFSVEIRPEALVKKIENIAIQPINLSKDFTVELKETTGTVTIHLTNGAPRPNITTAVLTVNCAGIIQEGSYTLPVKVILPANAGLSEDKSAAESGDDKNYQPEDLLSIVVDPEYVEITVKNPDNGEN